MRVLTARIGNGARRVHVSMCGVAFDRASRPPGSARHMRGENGRRLTRRAARALHAAAAAGHAFSLGWWPRPRPRSTISVTCTHTNRTRERLGFTKSPSPSPWLDGFCVAPIAGMISSCSRISTWQIGRSRRVFGSPLVP
jgi:hypothetical protein